MPEYTALLGRLLSDAKLRAEFVAHPNEFSSCYPDELRKLLLALDLAALERQAQGLLTKRLHEVTFLLPSTAAKLGSQFAPLFMEYASTHWPTSHRRHMEDAVGFGSWLIERGEAVDRRELAHLEMKLGKRSLHLDVSRQGHRASLNLTYRSPRGLETISVTIGG